MRVNLRVLLAALLFCALAVGGAANGQTIGSGPHAAQIPAGAFFQTTPSTDWGAKFYLYPNSANAVELRAPVNVPSGANIYMFGLYYYDASVAGDVTAELWSIPGDTSLDPELIGTATSGTSAGYGYATKENLNYTVHNDVANDTAGAHVYMVVHLPANAQADAAFKAVDLRYNTTISAPPPFGNQTFLDVPPSHPFFLFIEALAKGEITAGCGDFNYCPDAPVTRGQMAVFIAKAMGLFWY